MLCPDISSFLIEGGELGSANMTCTVHAMPGISDAAATKGVIFSTEISRYFNPKFYQENGFQSAISLNQDVYYVVNGTLASESKYIKKSDVEYFYFEFLDTSAISVIDLDIEFENYKIETTKYKNLHQGKGQDQTGL